MSRANRPPQEGGRFVVPGRTASAWRRDELPLEGGGEPAGELVVRPVAPTDEKVIEARVDEREDDVGCALRIDVRSERPAIRDRRDDVPAADPPFRCDLLPDGGGLGVDMSRSADRL